MRAVPIFLRVRPHRRQIRRAGFADRGMVGASIVSGGMGPMRPTALVSLARISVLAQYSLARGQHSGMPRTPVSAMIAATSTRDAPTAVPVVSRHHLSLRRSTLDVLNKAAQTALNVPAARAACATLGRATAAATIKGRRVQAVDMGTEACRVVAVRAVELTPPVSPCGTIKKKRRSGRSNWPKTKAEREAWMARRAARQQQPGHVCGAGAGPGGGVNAGGADGGPYRPASASERSAFGQVANAVASCLGVPVSRISAPTLRVSMSTPSGSRRLDRQWWRQHRHAEPAQLCIALAPSTPAPRIRLGFGEASSNSDSISVEPLAAGQMLCIEHHSEPWVSPGVGDFVLTISASVA